MAKRKTAKVTSANELTVSPFKLDALQVEDLRRKLAKRANQRLVRLERRKAATGESLAELGIAQYAYESIKEIRAQEGKAPTQGKLRFRESKRPLTDTASRMELYRLQSFLANETSKAGTAAKYVSKTEKTLKERGVYMGENKEGKPIYHKIQAAGYKSFYNFLNSAAFANLKLELNSNEIVDLYNKAHEEGISFKKLDQAIAEYVQELEDTQKEASLKDLAEAMGTSVI